MNILTDEESMMQGLTDFFSNDKNYNILYEFINGRRIKGSKLSCGLLDWFCVNYAKMHNIQYILEKGNIKKHVLVTQIYRSALHSYGKKKFDPYARSKSDGVYVITCGNKTLSTTLRQLNYFKWAIEMGIIEYVKLNRDKIYDDFVKRSKTDKKRGKKTDSILIQSLNIQNAQHIVT